MAIENVVLIQKCFLGHLCMETVRLKEGKKTEKEDQQKKSGNGKKYSGHEKEAEL